MVTLPGLPGWWKNYIEGPGIQDLIQFNPNLLSSSYVPVPCLVLWLWSEPDGHWPSAFTGLTVGGGSWILSGLSASEVYGAVGMCMCVVGGYYLGLGVRKASWSKGLFG